MRTAVVLPVKRFALAKQRLGATVTDPLRLSLVAAMVSDVLASLRAVEALELMIVVTDEPGVRAEARELGALVLADSGAASQSAAAALGLARARVEGMQRALLVPGDCPSLEPAEIQRLLALPEGAPAGAGRLRGGAGAREVVIIPDRHGSGTNGLLLQPPDVIEPAFGPGSCERHRALARASGARCRIERPASLLLDIDTGADLRALRERLERGSAPARHTRHLLADHPQAVGADATTRS